MTKKEELLEFIDTMPDHQMLFLKCNFNDSDTDIMHHNINMDKQSCKDFISNGYDDDLSSKTLDTLERPFTVEYWQFADKPIA
jgi:hypothetical protein